MGYHQVIHPNLLFRTVSTERSKQSAQAFSQSGLENLLGFHVNTLKINLTNLELYDNG